MKSLYMENDLNTEIDKIITIWHEYCFIYLCSFNNNQINNQMNFRRN